MLQFPASWPPSFASLMLHIRTDRKPAPHPAPRPNSTRAVAKEKGDGLFNHRPKPWNSMAPCRYCFSQAPTFFTFWPLSLTPVVRTVLSLPSADTMDVCVVVTLPSFFETVSTVF